MSAQSARGRLRVRVVADSGESFHVVCAPDECAADLKKRIEEVNRVPCGQQKVMFLNRELDDEEELRAAGIRDGQALQLAFRTARPLTSTSAIVPSSPGSPQNGSRIALRLRLPGGQQTFLEDVEEDTTGFELKSLIERDHGIRASHIELSFYGCPLDDDAPLANIGIAHNAPIDVGLRPPTPRGQSPPRSPRSPNGANASPGTSSFSRYPMAIEDSPSPPASAMSSPDPQQQKFQQPQEVDEDWQRGLDSPGGGSDPTLTYAVDMSPQDPDFDRLAQQARGMMAPQHSVDYVSRISKRSGYRLTLLVDIGRTERTAFGFTVYRFTDRVMHVMQLCARDENLQRRLAKWLVGHAKRCTMESMILRCIPEETDLFCRLGFSRCDDAPVLDDEEPQDGQVFLEYRCMRTKKPTARSAGYAGGTNFEPPPAFESKRKNVRKELLRSVFGLLDVDGDGYLGESEMRTFAIQTDFTGSREEWAEEYALLCSEKGLDPRRGLDQATFFDLLEDTSDKGSYCSNSELRSLVSNLEVLKLHEYLEKDPAPASSTSRGLSAGAAASSAALAPRSAAAEAPAGAGARADTYSNEVNPVVAAGPAPVGKSASGAPEAPPISESRRAKIRELFDALDTDRDGSLTDVETEIFARLSGFTGTASEWSQEYVNLCNEWKVQPNGGLNFEVFAMLVSTEADHGQYCSESEINEMVEALKQEKASAAAPTPSQSASASVTTQNGTNGQQARSQPSVVSDPAVDERSKLIHRLFILCDFNNSGTLQQVELETFARLSGFQGSSAEWAQEYKQLCRDRSVDPARGLDEPLFERLVNDESEQGQYCSVEEMRDMLAAVARNGIEAYYMGARQAGETPAKEETSPRVLNIDRLFHLLDEDGDGLLQEPEMGRYARISGFDGSDAEWASEYKSVCADRGKLDPRRGFDLQAFRGLLEDRSDLGQYCSDEELAEMISTLSADVAKRRGEKERGAVLAQAAQAAAVDATGGAPGLAKPLSRRSLIRAVFHACDTDGNGRLNDSEMLLFARHTGFDGDASRWKEEYATLCEENGKTVSQGIDEALFMDLVEDTSDKGCYSTDEELRTMLRATFPSVRERANSIASSSRSRPVAEGAAGSASAAAVRRPSGTSLGGASVLSQMSEASKKRREALIAQVFRLCDTDGDGKLKMKEMRTFATYVGFMGDDSEWAEEYAALISEVPDAKARGIDLKVFTILVNDGSDDGCFCNDEELQRFITQTQRAS